MGALSVEFFESWRRKYNLGAENISDTKYLSTNGL
jgi:hypothetical protein